VRKRYGSEVRAIQCLSVPEIAKRLGVQVDRVRDLIAAGLIPILLPVSMAPPGHIPQDEYDGANEIGTPGGRA
jgi:hypothetical protein